MTGLTKQRKQRNNIMSLPALSPAQAKRLMDDGALLVDVRDPHEHRRERVPGARNVPLSRLDNEQLPETAVVIFHCRSGMRTRMNIAQLAKAVHGEAYVVDGGIEAWRDAGLPVEGEPRKPIELARQVQLTAGTIGLLGGALGYFVHPGFFAISVFVGAGLFFAGSTGVCPMGKILARAPWNRNLDAKGAGSWA
jgi:rhodanese-related sulfurtransferase